MAFSKPTQHNSRWQWTRPLPQWHPLCIRMSCLRTEALTWLSSRYMINGLHWQSWWIVDVKSLGCGRLSKNRIGIRAQNAQIFASALETATSEKISCSERDDNTKLWLEENNWHSFFCFTRIILEFYSIISAQVQGKLKDPSSCSKKGSIQDKHRMF